MLDQIVKTDFLRRLDAETRNRAKYNMNEVVADFDPDSPLTLLDLVKKYKVALDPTQAQHVQDHWLDNQAGWFQHPLNLTVLRRGMFELVKLVRDWDLPVDSYWVCYPQQISRQDIPIQLYISLGRSNITLLIVTPFPPPPPARPEPEATIWVTSVEKDAQGAEMVTFRNAQF
jgi:hypothetical protein